MDQDRIDRIRIFVWFLKRNFPESDSRCHKWWWRCSLCYDYYKQKIQMILSVCAALMTINDNSCYFIANIFRRGGSSKLLLYCWYAASFCYAEWLAYVCVVLVNIVYFMGGQLVFDLDRLEIFLITRDWPVGNIVTNTKYQSWLSHGQMQCTTALVSDAQAEGKVSVRSKSWLQSNNRKTDYNTFVAFAELAYGQPSQEAPKNIRDQPIDGQFLCTLWNIDWKMLFLGSLPIRCKIRRNWINQVALGDQPVVVINLLATPGLFQCLRFHFLISFRLEFWTFYLKFSAVNLC